jgi:hypothetical protein
VAAADIEIVPIQGDLTVGDYLPITDADRL